MQRIRSYLPYLGVIAFVVGFLNFGWFITEVMTTGDALNGYASGGHYYVSLKPGYREVDEATWNWLRVHGISVFVTHPLAILGGWWYYAAIGFPRAIRGSAPWSSACVRVEAVRRSGSLRDSVRCGGRIGSLSISGPLTKIEIYPGGLVVTPLFMSPRAILARELAAVVQRTSLLARGLEIDHKGVDLKSPLILAIKPDSRAAAWIRWLFDQAKAGTAPEAALEAIPWTHDWGGEPGPIEEAFDRNPVLKLALSLVVILVASGVIGLPGVFWPYGNLGSAGLVWTVGVLAVGAFNGVKTIRKYRDALRALHPQR